MTNSSLARQLCATMFIVTVCSAVTIQIQVEATILQEERRISWSGAGYPGDIPFVLNQVNVLDFGAIPDGVTDNASAIAAAIAAAPSPGVVFFPEGTYRFNSPIQLSSGIVLRGAGYKKTHLECNLSGAAQTCIQAVTYQRGDFTRILSGMSKGSTLLTVEDASNFTVGNPAEIQQENDPAIMYTNPEWNQSWAQNAVGQFVRITAINGNTLKLDRPLNIDFRADLNAMIRPNGLISDVGIEDLHIRRLDAGDGHTIQFKNAANSWVRRVESEYTYRTHVSVTSSMNIEIRDSYFHHSHDYGGGGHGYGVDLNHHTTNCLVENNIFEHLRHAMMIHVGANGNVFGYNYSFDPVENSGNWMPPDISVHGHFPFMNLFEGNIVQEVGLSDWWGPAGPGNTLFRNRVETENIDLKDQSHSQNVVGNELTGGVNQITIQSGVMDSLVHGNNVNGVINWDPSAEDHQLPNSYYLLSKPIFFGSTPWPSLGGDQVLDSGTIPALERLLAGEPIPPATALQIFVDVPPSHWASAYIETLFEGGYVAGCSAEPLKFCPDQTMTRAESAVFVERGIHGAGYLPAQPQGAVFEDVPLWEWFAKWADGLWTDGYTAGCGTEPLIFCPLFDHTRAEATVFFERMLHGNVFVPAIPTEGRYDDVPVGPEAPWYSKWITAAYNDNILQECEDDNNRHDSTFRPLDGLTRAEAACMMVRAKGLR
ncbi:MAG: S-layer homology domain-containing protein [Anaerolineales bacterium]|nr:S-layer homology domain-containing protein [Anaerolineales bacterium]